MKTRLLLAVALVLLLAPPTIADTLVTGASWTPWMAPAQRNTTPFAGQPFWDNASFDGGNCNIGFWVSGTGQCAATSFYSQNFYQGSPDATPSYLGTGKATFTMTAGAPGSTTVSAQPGVSGVSGDNRDGSTELGWFPLNNRTDYHPLLEAGYPVAPVSVPSGNYGFYVTVYDRRPGVASTITYTSDTLDTFGRTHFAVFDLGNGNYVMGIEDMTGGFLSDYDYNDLMVAITTQPVPEPATLFLLGSGLVGLVGAARRRGRNR